MICGVSRLQLTSLPMNGMWCGFYVVGWALEHPSSLSTARPGVLVGDRILPTRRPGYVFPLEYVQRAREDKLRYVQSCNCATLIQDNRGQAYSSRCLWLLLKTLLFYSWLNRYEKLVWKPSLWSDIITIGWVLSLLVSLVEKATCARAKWVTVFTNDEQVTTSGTAAQLLTIVSQKRKWFSFPKHLPHLTILFTITTLRSGPTTKLCLKEIGRCGAGSRRAKPWVGHR